MKKCAEPNIILMVAGGMNTLFQGFLLLVKKTPFGSPNLRKERVFFINRYARFGYSWIFVRNK
jgi:hypothetical protein